MDNNNTNQEFEVSVMDVLAILFKRAVLIITAAIVFALLAFTYSKFFITPLYSGKATYMVVIQSKDSQQAAAATNSSEFTYLEKSTAATTYLFKTRSFLQDVIDTANLNYTTMELSDMITISVIEGSNMFTIKVVGSDPNEVFTIQETIASLTEEMISTNTLGTISVTIPDPAIVPKTASSPVLKYTLVGLAAGIIFGCALAVILEMLNNTIKSRADLISRFSMPVLVSIPSFNSDASKKRSKKSKNKNESTRTVEILNEKTPFAIKEAYKTLRTNLQFTINRSAEQKCAEVITVSSAVPMDGKSTTSVNLALTIAQTGAKVILIDCDLRKGRLHKFFTKVGNKVGASNVIPGLNKLDDAVQKTEYDGLSILTSGTVPPNPAELIASSNMAKMIDALRTRFDYVIIDTPPVNVVSDALPISKISEGVLLVVRQNQTSYADVENAIKNFELVGSNLLGFILNGVDIENGKSYKYKYNKSYYSYNSYYSNSDDESEGKSSHHHHKDGKASKEESNDKKQK